MKKETLLKFFQSILAGIGLLWLFIEAHNVLDSDAWNISFLLFLITGIVVGILWFFINGFLVEGFLRQSICITSNAFQTKIKVFYGDLFKQDGYKAIAVNEHFDSIVDNMHVSEKSLHGMLLKKYWDNNVQDWDKQVEKELKSTKFVDIGQRDSGGKQKKYDIGSTAMVENGRNRFFCFALSKTDVDNLEAHATTEEMQKALSGLLQKARSVCAGEKLSIPLIGSGLSRTGIKTNILINLILIAIFEESKKKKITDEINIVLSGNMKSEISLLAIEQDWR